MQIPEKISMENLGYGLKKIVSGIYQFGRGLMKKL